MRGARWIRLSQSWWWRGFWLCWFAGFGSWDLVSDRWPFALVMAAMLIVIVVLWMAIDRNTAKRQS